MAHGFMQSFDPALQVFSAGTNPALRVDPGAVAAMAEVGIDIGGRTPRDVREYLDEAWDHVITVCDDANEHCPAFLGRVAHRVHLGFEDPSRATGTPEFVAEEYRRIRDRIRGALYAYYTHVVRGGETVPKCSCGCCG